MFTRPRVAWQQPKGKPPGCTVYCVMRFKVNLALMIFIDGRLPRERQESDINPLISPHTVSLDVDTEHCLFMVLSSQDRLLGLGLQTTSTMLVRNAPTCKYKGSCK